MSRFLPKNYEPPKSSNGYCKLQDGDTKLRILSEPILGWEDWTLDKKPVRYPYDQEKPKPIVEAKPVKHFWDMIVWNYNESALQILHITQASVRDGLMSLINDKEWGDPYFYDIKINKSGKEMKTKYAVNPLPHRPVAPGIRDIFEDTPINLQALFENQNPFECHPSDATPGIFEKASKSPQDQRSGSTPSEGTIEELIELLALNKVPSHRLQEWIDNRADVTNESTEAIVKSCLVKEVFPKFLKTYQKFLGPVDEEVPF